MNIILFEPEEIGLPLARADRRAVHLLQVLRRKPGETFDAGLIDGPRGKGCLLEIRDDALLLDFDWEDELPPCLDPITLILGMPRPQTARKLLQEATALGVSAMHLVSTDKGEPGYGCSVLWRSGEWRRHVIAGAEQAFATRLPQVSFDQKLSNVVLNLSDDSSRLALDNYEASMSLGEASLAAPVVLAVGSERGWSAPERTLLTAEGFRFACLGQRVLRVETACVAAISIVRTKLGLM